jgi:glycosyltransferase involved in cell wall biosynthesis
MRIADRPQRVLFIDPFLPMWDRSSGSNRLMRVIELMAGDGHEISFVAVNGNGEERYAQALADIGVTTYRSDRARLIQLEPNADLDAITTPPWDFQQVLVEQQFDVVVISFHSTAQHYLPIIRKALPHARIIIDTVDLHFVRELRAAELSNNPSDRQQAVARKHQELATYRKADALIAISDDERQVLLNELPNADAHVVPNIHEIDEIPVPFAQRSGLLFVGNFFHPPNGEGLWWFMQKVLPIIRESLPAVPVDIIGQNPPRQIVEQRSSLIRVHGWVPSIEQHLYSARLSIAPLLHGAGMKGKVGQAFASGLPVVTTTIGAEGFHVTDREHAMVTDDPAAFAAAVVDAYTDESLWRSLQANARKLIVDDFTPAAVRSLLREVVEPAPAAYIEMFGLPDWTDITGLAQLLDDYVTAFDGSKRCRLTLGILPGTTTDAAFTAAVQALAERGHDPERIPELSLVEVSMDALDHLAPDTVWVPSNDVPAPGHLRSTLESWSVRLPA